MDYLGIDVGGSAIKSALVNLEKGVFSTERLRIPMPKSAKPDDVRKIISKTISHFHYSGPVGCGFPAKVKNGIPQNAANIHKSWIGINIPEILHEETGLIFHVLNDADAAGLGEMTYSITPEDKRGLVLFLTLGTGIGSALFLNGELIPNSELGHLIMHNQDAEDYAAAAVRKEEKLSWSEWTQRLDEYLSHVNFLLSPDLIVIGGGISKDWKKFIPELQTQTRIAPARLRNQAGIIGAACYAATLEEIALD